MKPDLHSKPFDETTKAKLAIFKDYLVEWLPVFTKAKNIYWKRINIYDFFAGPGYDSDGHKGTPIIILDELRNHYDAIERNNLDVHINLNEFDSDKNELLKKNTLLSEEEIPYSIRVEQKDFRVFFEEEFAIMGNPGTANLIFLDQYGIKHITEDIFKKIIRLKRTDFLFFISSSTIYRFAEHPSVVQYIKIPSVELNRTPYHKIHTLVLDYFKSLIPKGHEYFLSSFSLKKGANIYGLIFGSGHHLGIEKFINTCWKLDPERGLANYDIDGDNILADQIDLFTNEVKKPKRIEVFERELERKILDREIKTDRELYMFMILGGFKESHVKTVIKKMIENNKLAKSKLTLNNKSVKTDYIPIKLQLL